MNRKACKGQVSLPLVDEETVEGKELCNVALGPTAKFLGTWYLSSFFPVTFQQRPSNVYTPNTTIISITMIKCLIKIAAILYVVA